MVRRYDPHRAVPTAALDRVVSSGLRGPSAGFSQGTEFLLLSQPDEVARYWSATTDPARPEDEWLRGMRTAPVLILCLADPDRYLGRYREPDKARAGLQRLPDWPVPYWDVDCGMGVMLMLLAVVDEGLGACFFGVPAKHHDAVRVAFAIPDRLRLVGVVSLGHPAAGERASGSGQHRTRRPAAETVHHGRYRQPS